MQPFKYSSKRIKNQMHYSLANINLLNVVTDKVIQKNDLKINVLG